jgi:hypothetical protein
MVWYPHSTLRRISPKEVVKISVLHLDVSLKRTASSLAQAIPWRGIGTLGWGIIL